MYTFFEKIHVAYATGAVLTTLLLCSETFRSCQWIINTLVLVRIGIDLWHSCRTKKDLGLRSREEGVHRAMIQACVDTLRQLMSLAHSKKTGWFCYMHGPMFAGKSTAVISLCNYFQRSGLKVVAIKYAKDDRLGMSDQNELCSHDGERFPGTFWKHHTYRIFLMSQENGICVRCSHPCHDIGASSSDSGSEWVESWCDCLWWRTIF